MGVYIECILGSGYEACECVLCLCSRCCRDSHRRKAIVSHRVAIEIRDNGLLIDMEESFSCQDVHIYVHVAF